VETRHLVIIKKNGIRDGGDAIVRAHLAHVVLFANHVRHKWQRHVVPHIRIEGDDLL